MNGSIVWCVLDDRTGQANTLKEHALSSSPPRRAVLKLILNDGDGLKTIPMPSPLTFTLGMSWHPNSTEIAFGGGAEGAQSYDIFSLNLKDGQIKKIIPDGILPAWSKNGLLAFTTYRDSNMEIYLADQEGRLRNLTRHDSPDVRPAWSPEGTRIAFECIRYGNPEICIADLDGTITRMTNHFAKDWNPVWTSKGEVAFLSNRDGIGGIYVKGTKVTRLPSHESDLQLSWSPDGDNYCFLSSRPEPFWGWLVRLVDF